MPRTDDPDARLLQGAADPARLAILRRLGAAAEVCACEFADCCGLAQPTISHHLKVLRETGWVTSERRGLWVWYRLRPEAARRAATLIAELLPVGEGVAGIGGRLLPVVDATERA